MPLGANINAGEPEKISFKANYDKELEQETHQRYTQEIGNVQAHLMEGRKVITDPAFIGRFASLLSDTKRLFLKYKETKAAEEVEGKEKELSNLQMPMLDTKAALTILQHFRDELAITMGVKHNFKDSVEHREPWDNNVAKKLELPRVFPREQEEAWGRFSDEVWAYYDALHGKLKRLCFLISMDITMNNGDANILLSGPKKSGKTNTAEVQLRLINRFLREFWHAPKYNEEYLKEHPDFLKKHPEARYEVVDAFRIRRDMLVTPSPDEMQSRMNDAFQYQTIDVNEGMEVATNLQSMQKEKIEVGIRMFTTRSLHSVVIWEYQVAKRPTGLMLEGMNYWEQKMGKKWFVLSMASHLVRKADPYYMAELEKCRTDMEISRWISGRGTNTNPNFVSKFKAPHMSQRNQRIFDSHYKSRRMAKAESEGLEKEVRQAKIEHVKYVWELVNERNLMSPLSIRSLLMKPPEDGGLGYNDKQAERFMKKYSEYDEEQRWKRYGKKLKIEESE